MEKVKNENLKRQMPKLEQALNYVCNYTNLIKTNQNIEDSIKEDIVKTLKMKLGEVRKEWNILNDLIQERTK